MMFPESLGFGANFVSYQMIGKRVTRSRAKAAMEFVTLEWYVDIDDLVIGLGWVGFD